MANFSGGEASIDALIRQLASADLFDEDFQDDLLTSGAEIMKTEAVRNMKSDKLVETGATVKNIGYTKKVKVLKTGARRLSVTVKGKDNRGERYATKAFVLNYGRGVKDGYIPASYFWTRARKQAEQKTTKDWESKIINRLKSKGLI